MKKFIGLFLSFGMLVLETSCSIFQSDAITLESLLDEMLSVQALTEWPEKEYQQLQVSSYDRRSQNAGNADWFANDDGYGIIRVDTIDGRIEKVLFDEQQPGVITRIWNTTTVTKGTLRFYFDGHTTPDWVIPAYDFTCFGLDAVGQGLLECHTNYETGQRGGNTFFLPIPYAKSCKITLEEPAEGKNYPRYYQINFRRYAEKTPIETFSKEVARRASEKITEVCDALKIPLDPEGDLIKKEAVLTKGKHLSIPLPKGNYVVSALKITLKSEGDYGDQMRRMIISASFDGVQTVWVPLSDFSGAGLGAAPVHSRYLEADGKQTSICYWPMPYKDSAIVTLNNISDIASTVQVEVWVKTHEFTDKTLYFHSSWRQECGLPVSNIHAECREWDFATLNGRGIYRGDVLTLFNYSEKWYGEGDEKIYVDGEDFPSHFGTGTEDYYNSSWAPVVPFHTPFGGAPRADLSSSKGYNSWLRTRALDAIPFKKELNFDIELISWVPGKVDYATTIYWYGDLNAIAEGVSGTDEAMRVMPEPPEDPTKYVIAENALEFEKAEITGTSESLIVNKQDMSVFSGGKWSCAEQLTCKGDIGDNINVKFIDVPNGCYRIKLHATKAIDYAKVRFSINGDYRITFDGYAKDVVNSGAIDLGKVNITDGCIIVRADIIGKNRDSRGYLIGLDCLVIEKI